MIHSDFLDHYYYVASAPALATDKDYWELKRLEVALFKQIENTIVTHGDLGERHLINTVDTLINVPFFEKLNDYLDKYVVEKTLTGNEKFRDSHYHCVFDILYMPNFCVESLFDLHIKYFPKSLEDPSFRDKVKANSYRYRSIHRKILDFESKLVKQDGFIPAGPSTSTPFRTKQDSTPYYLNSYKNFLNEITAIERDIESRCNIVAQRKLNPTEYEPIATLWERIGNSEKVTARNLYREEIKDRIEFALSHISSIYIRSYETDVKKQPDKQAALLIQHREKILKLLEESYPPTIQYWFYGFWNEKKQIVERIDDLEKEVFHFCDTNNKPFMVGLRLQQQVYAYCLAIERLNRLLNRNKPITQPRNEENNSCKSLADLFIQLKDMRDCIDALQRIRPDKPVISDTRRWQNRDGSKAILAAWIKRMEDVDKIKFISDKKLLVPLLNDFFPGLDLGAEARTLKDPDINLVAEFSALILP